MTPYLARLLEISLNNVIIPNDWKIPQWFIYTKGVIDRQRMEHIIAGYWRQVWDKNDWLYEGQHGFRPGYSCESQVVTVCQDIADSLDKGSV
jgi:hypothetical protein